jgi:hypothetical protein
VTKHLSSAANLSATSKDRQQFANAAGDCIYKESPSELGGELNKEFEHLGIIALSHRIE